MKLLFDLFPVLLFFGTFKYSEKNPELALSLIGKILDPATLDVKQAPILLATLVVILATVGQILWVRFRHGHVDRMLWVSLILVVVFGGLTLVFHDETFIKWKPTILYWAFASSIAFALFVLRKNPIGAMLGEQLSLPDPVWQKVNIAWIVFFALMGGLNLLVAYQFSTDTWVNFKLFGGMGLLFLFVIGQGLALSKYMEEKS